jgi:hypothetical protein
MIAPISKHEKPRKLRYEPIAEPALDGRIVECPTCQRVYADSQVVEDRPVVSRDHKNQAVMPCKFHCGHCNHLVTWLAGVDLLTGRRNRNVISGPGLIRDQRAIASFLQKHPKACETAPA